ncbi:hypothetical protein GCM10007870_25900 [Gluconobacter kondonii]|uniref:Uncharacterized protein n=1 Tax=Gluconobacter kondonii TaxID=941463 RepID=A0ABQ5WTY8_9PROT|nr:hypothetical protein GCM10007870_25900 [Gluconobacter kondonii]
MQVTRQKARVLWPKLLTRLAVSEAQVPPGSWEPLGRSAFGPRQRASWRWSEPL